MRALSLAIVGSQYPNKRGPTRRFELELCAPGEPVELRPEPRNPADPRAIAVYSCRGVQLGYITAERAPLIGAMLANGREVRAVFQGIAATGAWLRVAFDGEEPVLPYLRAANDLEAARRSDDQSGFWPDEVFDD